MLTLTNYTVSEEVLQHAIHSIPSTDFRIALNQPTGRFFNDPWEIKPEFKDSVWDTILNTLDEPKGEARLIQLEPGACYPSHADIDDRWHLPITGNNSYLIDLENNELFPIDWHGVWYLMDAGRKHSAANFGTCSRIQLVVRKLLPAPNIAYPINVSIKLKILTDNRRFIFDDVISPWLNRAYKAGIVDNFKGEDLEATFTMDASAVKELEQLSRAHFTLTVL
jgi:hypothetical protein